MEFPLKLSLFNLNIYWLRLEFNPIAYMFSFLLVVVTVLTFPTNSNVTLAAIASHRPQPIVDDTEPATVIITSPTASQSFFVGATQRLLLSFVLLIMLV